MEFKTATNAFRIWLALFLFIGFAAAVTVLNQFRYERPIRSIRGKVIAFGQVVPGFWVDVYDKARVPLDDATPQFDKMKEQAKVVSVEPDEKGNFNIQHLPKGLYEVRFGNRGEGGYNTVSLVVKIDPKGARDNLCVDVGLESSSHTSSVRKCGGKPLKEY